MQIFDYIPLRTRQSPHGHRLRNGCLLLALGASVAALIPLTQALLEAAQVHSYGATKKKSSVSPSNKPSGGVLTLKPAKTKTFTLTSRNGKGKLPSERKVRTAAARAMAQHLVPGHSGPLETKKPTTTQPPVSPSTTALHRSAPIISQINALVNKTQQTVNHLKTKKATLVATIKKLQTNSSSDLAKLNSTATTVSNQVTSEVTTKRNKDASALATAKKALSSVNVSLKKATSTVQTAKTALAEASSTVTKDSVAYKAAEKALLGTDSAMKTEDSQLDHEYQEHHRHRHNIHKRHEIDHNITLIQKAIQLLAATYKTQAIKVNLYDALYKRALADRSSDEKALAKAQVTFTQQTKRQSQLANAVTSDAASVTRDNSALTQLNVENKNLVYDRENAYDWQDEALPEENQAIAGDFTLQTPEFEHWGSKTGATFATSYVGWWSAGEAQEVKEILNTAKTVLTPSQLSTVTKEAQTIAPEEGSDYTMKDLTTSIDGEVEDTLTPGKYKVAPGTFGDFMAAEEATDTDVQTAAPVTKNLNSAETSLTKDQNQLALAQKHLALATDRVNTLEEQANAALASWVNDGNPDTLRGYNALVPQVNDLNGQIFQLSGTKRDNLSLVTAPIPSNTTSSPIPSNTTSDGNLEAAENEMRQNDLQERVASEGFLDDPALTSQTVSSRNR